jgi:hypothetical protein
VPRPGEPLSVIDLARVTEKAGLDVVGLADHPYWSERADTSADVIRRFAAEVVPATRELVTAARSGTAGLGAQPGRGTPASSV